MRFYDLKDLSDEEAIVTIKFYNNSILPNYKTQSSF